VKPDEEAVLREKFDKVAAVVSHAKDPEGNPLARYTFVSNEDTFIEIIKALDAKIGELREAGSTKLANRVLVARMNCTYSMNEYIPGVTEEESA
jgi:hypothetical protein